MSPSTQRSRADTSARMPEDLDNLHFFRQQALRTACETDYIRISERCPHDSVCRGVLEMVVEHPLSYY
ncbi:MAG: hypothetical protein MI923_19500 [Phycisphaerales bacterium]|nr:hypothetical protein [Phycisphaerales bacterium]